MSDDETGDGVLSNLPSTRPQHRSAKRSAPSSKKPAAGGAAASKGRTAPDKRRARARTGRMPSEHTRPAAQGFQAPQASQRELAPPSNTDILVSAVRAAGELAQAGLTLGEHVARAAARRLKP